MKILVYNYQYQFALSRKQIETIKETIPKEYFEPIKEFHLTSSSPGQENFEYDYNTKTAFFEYCIKEKDNKIIEDAVSKVLFGLARIKMKSKFGHYITQNEINTCQPFVEKWLMACLRSIEKIK